VYAHSSDAVDRNAKDLLEHLESQLSDEDFEEAHFFVKELVGYIKESDEDRKELEGKVAKLELAVSRLNEAKNTAFFWFLVFIGYQAYQTGFLVELIVCGVLGFLFFKAYEAFERRQNRKLVESLKKGKAET